MKNLSLAVSFFLLLIAHPVALLVGAVLLTACPRAEAVAYGTLNNFDCVNDTGSEAHGFDIELDDMHSTDVTYTYDYNHYGIPKISQDNTDPLHPKVLVRYAGTYSNGVWSAFTAIPAGPIAPTAGHQFTNPAVNFGGEHFGVSYYGTPSAVKYNWLLDGGAGNLIHGPPVNVSTPTFSYNPPAGGAAANVVAVVVPPPPPVLPPKQFGDAQWVKEIKTQTHNAGKVQLQELVAEDPGVPQPWANGEPTQVEVEWKILQTEFAKPANPKGVLQGAAEDLPGGDEVITRRYEFYKYTGPLDAETGEAVADAVGADGSHGSGTVTYADHFDPNTGEFVTVTVDMSTLVVVGDFFGAQMSGFDVAPALGLVDHIQDGDANVQYPDRTVVVAGADPFVADVKAGSGALPDGLTLDPVSGVLSGTPTVPGTFTFTLEASTTGGAPVSRAYTVMIAGAAPVTSTIATSAAPTLGGTTTGDGSYNNGTNVTVTATQNAGFAFVNWTEGGTVVSALASYSFTASADRTLVANFAATQITATFDFDTGTPAVTATQGMPASQTANGITAYFSSPTPGAGGFSVQSDATTQYHMSQFSGNYLWPNSVYSPALDIQFSQPLTAITFTFATADFQQVEIPTTVQCTGYVDSTATAAVGFATAHGTYGTDTMPMGTLTFNSATPFNVVEIKIPYAPLAASDFLIDNIIVTATGAAQPMITSALTLTTTVGANFTYQISASNNPTLFAATNLPPGLAVDPGTGIISGMPQAAEANRQIGLSATGTGGAATANLSLTITAATPPAITSALTATATVGTAFSYQTVASNTPTSFAATNLPTGVTVDTGTGLLSGTPQAAETNRQIGLTATNAGGSANATLWLTIAKGAQTISFDAVPDLIVGSAPYTLHATSSAGLAVTFAVVSGPATLSGGALTPTGPGTVVLKASQAGDANHTPAADVTQTIHIAQAATVAKLAATFKFTATGKDTCAVSGSLPGVPQGFTFAGKMAMVNVSGALVEFTLDAKGKGKPATGKSTLVLKAKFTKGTSGFVGGALPFQATLKGALASYWAGIGVVPTASVMKQPVSVPVEVTLDTLTYATVASAALTCKANKGGMLKK
jgi:hypothetical protein